MEDLADIQAEWDQEDIEMSDKFKTPNNKRNRFQEQSSRKTKKRRRISRPKSVKMVQNPKNKYTAAHILSTGFGDMTAKEEVKFLWNQSRKGKRKKGRKTRRKRRKSNRKTRRKRRKSNRKTRRKHRKKK